MSDDSRGTSTQTIINNVENEGEENKSVSADSDKNSVHSNWSELVSVDEEVEYTKLKSVLFKLMGSINRELKRILVHPHLMLPQEKL